MMAALCIFSAVKKVTQSFLDAVKMQSAAVIQNSELFSISLLRINFECTDIWASITVGSDASLFLKLIRSKLIEFRWVYSEFITKMNRLTTHSK